MKKIIFLVILFFIIYCGAIAVYAQEAGYNYREENGYTILENPDGTVQVKSTFNTDNTIEINGNTIDLKPNSELTIKNNNEFQLIGEGDLTIHGRKLAGIKNAIIKSDGKDIVYADFTSAKGGTYGFIFNKYRYDYTAQAGTKVVFDPLGGKISGEKAALQISLQDRPAFGIDSAKSFSISLKDGNPYRVDLGEGGTFYHKGIFRATQGGLSIFLNGESIKNFEGNAISFNDERNVMSLKGFVKYSREGTTLNYEGLSGDAYTDFDYFGKSHFDVQQGDARIDNGKHEVLIHNGEAKLRLKNSGAVIADDFSFSSYDKGGRELKGFIRERQGSYEITSFDDEGNLKTVSLPLSAFNNRISASINELFDTKTGRAVVEKDLRAVVTEIESKLKELNKDDPDYQKNYDALRFEKIIVEGNIARLKNEPTESYTNQLRDYIQQVQTPELKLRAQYVLAEMLIQNANAKGIPSKYSYEAWIGTGNNRYPQGSIDFEVIDGKVTAVLKDNKRYPLSISKDEIKSNVPRSLDYVIDELYKNNEVAHLEEIAVPSGSTVIQKGVSTDSPLYQVLEKQINEAQQLLGQTINDPELSGASRLLLAQSYGKLGGSDRSMQELEKVMQNTADTSVKSEAARLVGVTLFSEDPRKNAQQAMVELQRAIMLSEGNEQAQKSLLKIKSSLINDRVRLYANEPEKILNDVNRILGQGSENDPWYEQSQDGLFHPYTLYYYKISGRAQEILGEQQTLLDANNYGLVGAQGLRSLVENNVDIEAFHSAPILEQFSTVARAQGLDRIISPEELRTLVTDNAIDFSSRTTYPQEVRRLFESIEKKYGAEAANTYFSQFNKGMYTLGAVDYALQNDRALYLIASNGNGFQTIPYSGEQAGNPFIVDRIGKSIERNVYESGVIQASDFVISAALLGLGGKAVGLAGEALGVGKYVQGVRTVLSPGEFLAVKTIGDVAPKTATVLGIGGDIAAQTSISHALHAISPDFAGVYDIVSLFGNYGRKAAEKVGGLIKELSIVENAAGDVKYFVRAESEEAAEQIAKQLRDEGRDVLENIGTFNREKIKNLPLEKQKAFEEKYETLTKMVSEYEKNPDKVSNELLDIIDQADSFDDQTWKGVHIFTSEELLIIDAEEIKGLSLLSADERGKAITKIIDDYQKSNSLVFGKVEGNSFAVLPKGGLIIQDKKSPHFLESGEIEDAMRGPNFDDPIEREIARRVDAITFEELLHSAQFSAGEPILLSPYTEEFGEYLANKVLRGELSREAFKELTSNRVELDIAAFLYEHNPQFIDDLFLNNYKGRREIIDFIKSKNILVGSEIPREFSEIAPINLENVDTAMRELLDANSESALRGQKTLSTLRDRAELVPREILTIDPERLDLWKNINIKFDRNKQAIVRSSSPEEIAVKEKVLNNLQKVSFSEFEENLERSVNDLNKAMRDQESPYVVLYGTPHKSNRWVYELSKDSFETKPYEESYFDLNYELNPGHPTPKKNSNLERWIREGVNTFVVPDDAIYSGAQVTDYFLRPLADTYTAAGKELNVYFVAPYTTSFAHQTIKYNAERYPGIKVHVISQKNMKTINELLTPEERRLYPIDDGVTATYFDHKIPDFVSFDEGLADTLHSDDHVPVYKKQSGKYYEKEEEEFLRYAEPWKFSNSGKMIAELTHLIISSISHFINNVHQTSYSFSVYFIHCITVFEITSNDCSISNH